MNHDNKQTVKSGKPWQAPHRPVKSRDLTTQALLCGDLTDRKILHYILAGYYGREAQLRAQAAMKKPVKRIDSLAAAKKLLHDLLS